MPDTEQKALTLFAGGYNCAQAVLGAFSEQLNFEQNTAFRIACGFGGGFRRGEVCGAVSGAVMAIGLRCGQYIKNDTAQKGYCYMKTHEFMDKFTARNGSILCRELLGGDIWNSNEAARQDMQSLFKTLCPGFVAGAVSILENMEWEMDHK